ncbi:TPA: hypothetical protein P8734_005687 [Pseudomonas aeruginosa]|nr:hypothetical protein [Pseudomonas aeruginosa]
MAKETYTVVKSTDQKSKQHFTDAKEAAKAFSEIAASEKPTVIKSVEGKGAQFIGGTTEKRLGDEVSHSKYISHTDKAFSEAWYAAERNKQSALERDRERVIEKEGAAVDFSKTEKPEVGKTYRGPILAVTDEIIVQRHTDEKTGKQVDIAHDKAKVFNYADKQESIGKSHQIAYPHSKSGFARELQPSELQKAPAPQHEAGKAASMERGR